MVSPFARLTCVAAFIAFFLGCTTGSFKQGTQLDDNWGRSYETARTQQILNPAAGKNLDPVAGLDGDGALRGMERYRNGFEQSEQDSSYSINLTPVGAGK